MSTFLGLGLLLLGVLCVVAGAQNRGTQLAQTVLGTRASGTAAAGHPAAAVTPAKPAADKGTWT